MATKLATDWKPGKDWTDRLLEKLLFFIPRSLPGYEENLHLVKLWLVEFDADGVPWREIGLSAENSVVLAGPSRRDYGFWLDTNMKYDDFEGTPIDADEFERYWAQSVSFRSGHA